MRIGHVVTYVSEPNEFGGPVTVARTQAAVLAARGHDVTVYAAGPVPRQSAETVDGVTTLLFPALKVGAGLGFAGIWPRGLRRRLRADLRSLDVLHVHMARDLVTLPAAHLAIGGRARLVVQSHGMIDHSDRHLAKIADLWTGRVLRAASAVLTLTDQEDHDIWSVAPGASTLRVPNAVDVRADPAPLETRARLVLFLARLHPRKRVKAFVEMAELVGRVLPDARFVVAGPDEGDGAELCRLLEASPLGSRIRWVGGVSSAEAAALMRSAMVYVLPSVGEVFPMSVLEAFAEGTPVVAHDSIGMADLCREYDAAVLTDGSPSNLASAVQGLLASPTARAVARAGGQRLIRERLSPDALIDTLERVYSGGRRG